MIIFIVKCNRHIFIAGVPTNHTKFDYQFEYELNRDRKASKFIS